MKKGLLIFTILLCFPYFSLFVWEPSEPTVLSGQADTLSVQETSSAATSLPYYVKKIGADDTASTIAGYPIKDTVVAIIDTGAELDHEDLVDSLWINEAEKNGEDNVDDDGNGYVDDIYGIDFVNNTPTANPDDPSAPLRYGTPEDDSNTSHGTHVSGIIGMNPDNSSGYAGIGYHTKIMILKAGNYKNSFSFASAKEAVKYAVANGADIINMSFGSYKQNDSFADELEIASKSCLLVAAAGNDGKASSNSAMYPAAYPYVIGVMAADTEYNLWASSNYTDSSPAPYDIICPGESILSTTRYQSYAEKSGTSMASPMVAGSAAVIMGFLEANKTYTSREELLADTQKYLLMSDSVYTYTSDSGLLYITPRLNLKHSLQHIIEDLNSEPTSASPTAPTTTSKATALPTVTSTPAVLPTATPIVTIVPTVTPAKTPIPTTAPAGTPAKTPIPTDTPAASSSATKAPQATTPPAANPTISAAPMTSVAPGTPTVTTTPVTTAPKQNTKKSLRMKGVKIQKKKKRVYIIKWKKCKLATRYQIRIKDRKKGETRWYYTKKRTLKIHLQKSYKRYQICIRAQKISAKKVYNGPYKKL